MLNNTREKNVLEHFIDSNKKMILASRYQNTIYDGKTLCEYFGVESKTKKDGNSLEELINEAIYELPAFYYQHFMKHLDIYERYSHLRLRVGQSLYPIDRLIKYFDDYKDKEWVPILCQGIRWCSDRRRITYINTHTLKTKEEVMLSSKDDVRITEKLLERKRVEYLMKAKWSDYEPFIAELEESYRQDEKKEAEQDEALEKLVNEIKENMKIVEEKLGI